jgi:hypothetical protein
VSPKVRTAEEPFPDRKAEHDKEIAALRQNMGAIVKIVFTALAALLALGALLVAGGSVISPENSLVKLVWHLVNVFDGPFAKDNGIFTFDGANADKLDAVVNWGLGAVVYMAIGNFLRALIRPKGKKS